MVEVVFCQDIIFLSRVHIYSTRDLSGELLVGGLGGGGGWRRGPVMLIGTCKVAE